MEYFKQADKYLFNSEQPFLWKMSGMAGYENEIDKTITHLFYRLLKETHVADERQLLFPSNDNYFSRQSLLK